MKFPKAKAEFLSAAQVARKSEAQFFFLLDDDGTSLSTREFQAKCWDSRKSSRYAREKSRCAYLFDSHSD